MENSGTASGEEGMKRAEIPVEFFPEKRLDKATIMSHNMKNDISVAK